MRVSFVIMMMIAVSCGGCGVTRPKPNSSQQWGFWSHVPGTSAYQARRAETKEDKVNEAKKQLTRATEDLVTTAHGEVKTNTPLAAAVVIAKQNTQLHGLPDKPINTAPLITTNTIVRDKAWDELMHAFGKQQKELAYIRKVFELERTKGEEAVKQDSSLAVTAWNFKQWAFSFLLRNWWVLLLAGFAVWQIGKVAANIYCPPLAIGLNAVEGVASSAVRQGFVQTVAAGEKFKAGLDKIVSDPELVEKIKEHLRVSQERSQDLSTQKIIKELTRKA